MARQRRCPLGQVCRRASAAPRFNAGDASVLVPASVTFPGLPLLRGSSDVVRAVIAEATIASQNIASAVAVFERVILAVPIHTTFAYLDRRAPGSREGFGVSWTEAYRCKSSGSHQNRAYYHFSTSMQGLVITPRRLSLFQYVFYSIWERRRAAGAGPAACRRSPCAPC
jgi:hypothetical protein